MRVSDLMTTNVAAVRAHEPLSAAARMMWDCDCGAVPVLASDSKRVIGMLTDRDICMATWSKDRAPSTIRAEDAMSRQVFGCSPTDSLLSAETLMRSKKIRRIPVIDSNQELVGILSLADIVRQAGRVGTAGTRAATSDLAPHEITSTLADICQPTMVGSGPSAASARA